MTRRVAATPFAPGRLPVTSPGGLGERDRIQEARSAHNHALAGPVWCRDDTSLDRVEKV